MKLNLNKKKTNEVISLIKTNYDEKDQEHYEDEKNLLVKIKKDLEYEVSKCTSGKLSQALKGRHELMFKCKEYYLVDMRMQEEIETELGI